ncbi:MAG: IclR family transcriptional regulator C-terminal domain-containing protein [Thermodesulfobacteriota bacterium]|nr:IclR family transcriptional regulator C-terminal domain-containing protein [Thermodesulfobacteriota bacterium]
MKFDIGPGSKLPCYAASLGKVLLAGLSNEEFNKRLGKIEFYPITPKTILSKKKLRQEIIETRKRGYGICDQELSLDMYSIAVPLLDNRGEVVAAINVSMEFSFRDNPNLVSTIRLLMEKGKMISNRLGYHGPYPSYPR